MEDSAEHFAEAWLRDHGNLLYSYALARVGGDTAVAEDLVQETLLAGIQGYARFKQEAKLETWLVGILRRKLVDHFRKSYRRSKEITVAEFFSPKGHVKNIAKWQGDPQALYDALKSQLNDILTPCSKPLTIDESKTPYVILMVGVNGTGKTTTIGKLAKKIQQEGKSVMLAASDTFRAAAIE